VNFFLLVHRSIFDPTLYREIPQLGRRVIFFFVIKLILIASGISAIAHTCHVFSASKGAAVTIAEAFNGITIKDGRLMSNRPLPFEIPSQDLAVIYSRLINIPATLDTLQLPRVIVDTSSNPPIRTIPSIILRSQDAAFYTAPGGPQVVPYYKKSWYGPANLQFTEPGIRKLLMRVIAWLFTVNLVWDGLCCAGLTLFCICMFTVAAYIFRTERSRQIAYYFGIAGFAITPIPVGMVIIALASVTIPGTWQFLVIMSVVVMFRALIATMKTAKDADSGGV
jgi:hypothetical protein